MTWWIVACVILGMLEGAAVSVWEWLSGDELSTSTEMLIGAAVIGIMVGLVSYLEEKETETKK